MDDKKGKKVMIRCRINKSTYDLLKIILTKYNITFQSFLEIKVKEYIFNNYDVINEHFNRGSDV